MGDDNVEMRDGSVDPAYDAQSHAQGPGSVDGDDYARSSTSRFRFKSKKRTERHTKHSSRRHGDSEAQHRTKRARRSASHEDSEMSEAGGGIAAGFSSPFASSPGMSADAAFRESLFDAMADDEGAEYWEGVYGQPIHVYSNVKASTTGPKGELERMDDEEYAAYVRQRMWEKTHQHLMEEKARREAEKAKMKEEAGRRQREGERERTESDRVRREVEESLRRGQERRNRRLWKAKWESYLKGWEGLGSGNEGGDGVDSSTDGIARPSPKSIPWPVPSGSINDISRDSIQRFFLYAPTEGEEASEADLQKMLKVERVRWHPDKFQQRLGGGHRIDEQTMKAVTAVFQVIDGLWSEMRR